MLKFTVLINGNLQHIQFMFSIEHTNLRIKITKLREANRLHYRHMWLLVEHALNA